MGAAKKKKKVKPYKHFPWKDLETVGALLKKGLIPYEDFYPLKGVKKNEYIIIDPNKKIDLEADRQDKWENIPKLAKELYETPFEVIQVLLKGASLSNKEESTYILCCHIECDWEEKENKNLPLNALLDKNLENYCMFIGVPYSSINPSVRDYQNYGKKIDKKKHPRQKIIKRIVEKHRRLVIEKPDQFKRWMRDNRDYYRAQSTYNEPY